MINFLTKWFSGFLRRRRRLRHFGRHGLLDTLAGIGPREAVPDQLARDLLLVARDEPAAALARLHSHADGLSAREAAARLVRHGPNEVAHEKPLPWWLHLWHCYQNPFNLLLTVLALVSYLTEDVKATIVIGAMVALEHGDPLRAGGPLAPGRRKSEGDGQQHRHRDPPHAAARRPPTPIAPPQRLEIADARAGAGRLIVLSAGDMIPADCRVLSRARTCSSPRRR